MTQQDINEFPAKWNKILKDLPEFKDIADAASADELKKMVVMAEGNIYNIEKEKENDAKLNAAKEIAKEHSAPYRDAVKTQKCKANYCFYLLENKGTELGDKEED
jgi:hypothetical protein